MRKLNEVFRKGVVFGKNCFFEGKLFITGVSKVTCLFFLLSSISYGEVKLREPVKNFKMPMFNEKGFRSWEIFGDEGHYISDDQVNVLMMRLETFRGEEKSEVETLVKSSFAMLFTKEHEMKGDKDIKIWGQNYFAEGEDWKWSGIEKKFWINKNVKVVFEQKELVDF